VRQYLLDLYEIQKIDLEIREQQKRQDAIPAHLKTLETSVTQLQAKITSLRTQRDAAAQEAQTLRHVVEDEVQKIRKWESRLNDIRNQREYQALSRETEGSKRANRDAEEKTHELHKLQESLDVQLAELQEKLDAAQTLCGAEKVTVDAAVTQITDSMQQQIKRRDALIPRVPKPLFRKYDAIRSRRFGVGLSMVVVGCCQGCNMKLPPQLYNILQRGDSIEQCPSCHRLIFWENILPAPDASDAKGTSAHA
jgi:predicted  nucleic acid-binding Zn-ribbon protein